MIQTETAVLEWTPTGAVSYYPDGRMWGAHPHDVPHYHAIAHRLGYEGDTLAYAREHELAHHLVAEEFGKPSAVIWALAHGKKPSRMDAAHEEALAMVLQRYLRTNEVPLIDGINWSALRKRMQFLLEKEPA